ncbi:MAG TPA: hypothetical protein ENI70_01755 [Candidatus Peregrinibacteria bacterium]|nr:hypothetical protein [Candidatus Peregrinibacteria bacterium]
MNNRESAFQDRLVEDEDWLEKTFETLEELQKQSNFSTLFSGKKGADMWGKLLDGYKSYLSEKKAGEILLEERGSKVSYFVNEFLKFIVFLKFRENQEDKEKNGDNDFDPGTFSVLSIKDRGQWNNWWEENVSPEIKLSAYFVAKHKNDKDDKYVLLAINWRDDLPLSTIPIEGGLKLVDTGKEVDRLVVLPWNKVDLRNFAGDYDWKELKEKTVEIDEIDKKVAETADKIREVLLV